MCTKHFFQALFIGVFSGIMVGCHSASDTNPSEQEIAQPKIPPKPFEIIDGTPYWYGVGMDSILYGMSEHDVVDFKQEHNLDVVDWIILTDKVVMWRDSVEIVQIYEEIDSMLGIE